MLVPGRHRIRLGSQGHSNSDPLRGVKTDPSGAAVVSDEQTPLMAWSARSDRFRPTPVAGAGVTEWQAVWTISLM